MIDSQFDDIRPYHDDEINAAMCRIADNPLLKPIADYIFEGVDFEEVKTMFRNFQTSWDFQLNVMHIAIHVVVKKTMTKFTCEGINQLHNSKRYLFVSNHRDILLDSALLQIVLVDNGHKTTEISFGSNLMNPDFVVDVGLSNKMYKVVRGASPRDFYNNSKHLSEYIRFAIQNKNESVWIAQRNGRTKDGNDLTDQGILKMFSMSGSNNLIENFAELNIVPQSISYQFEPCIVSKVRELYVSKYGKYEKAPGEDLQSVLHGITQFKGNVHIEITKPISIEELQVFEGLSKTEIYTAILDLIDTKIQSNYKLFDTNYMAYDLVNKSQKFLNNEYSKEDLQKFIELMQKDISQINGNVDELEEIYLGIYANPVINVLKHKELHK